MDNSSSEKKIEILVACTDYPKKNNNALQFVHVRNKAYVDAGIKVTVLNFSAKDSYIHEGIKVKTVKDIDDNITKYENAILLLHAPNLRQHYRFLLRHHSIFKKRIYFFHGHEIVEIQKAYPKPYFYKKRNIIKKLIQSVYDKLKLSIWRNYFKNIDKDSPLIFVSKSLMKEFCNNMGFDESQIRDRSNVIYNCIGTVFEKTKYDIDKLKKYDYITIRSDIDNSVYCIDTIVCRAELNPDKQFLIIGKGDFFEYNKMPANITLINQVMTQDKLINYINESKVALMPTRRDSQGVMSCELASFGIPLITSNIAVCKEIFAGFDNVLLCDDAVLCRGNLEKHIYSKNYNEKYYNKNTIQKEIQLIKKIEKNKGENCEKVV